MKHKPLKATATQFVDIKVEVKDSPDQPTVHEYTLSIFPELMDPIGWDTDDFHKKKDAIASFPGIPPNFKFKVGSDTMRPMSEEKTASIPDDRIGPLADKVRECLTSLFRQFQEAGRINAKERFDTADNRPDISMLCKVRDELMCVWDEIDLAKKTSSASPHITLSHSLEACISSCLLILYEPWELDGTCTDREVVFLGLPALKLMASLDGTGKPTPERVYVELKELSSDAFVCLRDATPEYDVQVSIFNLLDDICKISAKKLKSIGAHDAAINALRLKQALGRRPVGYRECFQKEDARTFVNLFNDMLESFSLEYEYANLKTED